MITRAKFESGQLLKSPQDLLNAILEGHEIAERSERTGQQWQRISQMPEFRLYGKYAENFDHGTLYKVHNPCVKNGVYFTYPRVLNTPFYVPNIVGGVVDVDVAEYYWIGTLEQRTMVDRQLACENDEAARLLGREIIAFATNRSLE